MAQFRVRTLQGLHTNNQVNPGQRALKRCIPLVFSFFNAFKWWASLIYSRALTTISA